MSTTDDLRAEINLIREKQDRILAEAVRTNTLLDQLVLPQMKEMRTTVNLHESIRHRAIGWMIGISLSGGALGGKLAASLGLIGGNNKI
jgi:hypothetical protein